MEAIQRFLTKISIHKSGCWEWQGALNYGYGIIGIKGKTPRAHRWIYEYFYGQFPEELVINHICENKKCVNPLHLEAVTQRENMHYHIKNHGHPTKNKSNCVNGHALTEDNIIYLACRKRCRKCRINTQRRNRSKTKNKADLITALTHTLWLCRIMFPEVKLKGGRIVF